MLVSWWLMLVSSCFSCVVFVIVMCYFLRGFRRVFEQGGSGVALNAPELIGPNCIDQHSCSLEDSRIKYPWRYFILGSQWGLFFVSN